MVRSKKMMNDEEKTKQQLLNELSALRKGVTALSESESI